MKCPECGSRTIVDGDVLGTESAAARFSPDGLRLLTFDRGVDLNGGSNFHACADCGHLWNRVNPVTLRKLILRSGTERLKRKIIVRAREPGE
jgi:hypothetical protein